MTPSGQRGTGGTLSSARQPPPARPRRYGHETPDLYRHGCRQRSHRAHETVAHVLLPLLLLRAAVIAILASRHETRILGRPACRRDTATRT